MLQSLTQSRYHRGEIKTLLRPLLSCSFDPPGPRVLLKPNFVVPAPAHDPSTTHPQVYLAVAELLLERGFSVGIGESPAFGSCRSALRAHGVLDECLALGIEVVEFRRSRAYPGVAGERAYHTLTVAAELDDWDAVINLPKLKTHQQFAFTAACKNLYGCVSGKRKFFRHNRCGNDPQRFARMILANARRVGCLLHIGDGVLAMHRTGPRGGEAFPLHRLLVATDPLSHDWLFCRLIGLDPRTTPLFRALGPAGSRAAERACREITAAPGFAAAEGFVHAPLRPISFNPWHVARSGWRSLRQGLAAG